MAVDPSLWSNVPYRNPTAWRDFVGTHYLWHRSLSEHVARTLGVSYRVPPIGDGGGAVWLQAVQQTYVNASQALGLAPPADLSSYDLREPDQFASWTFLVSQSARRLRVAGGLS